MVVQRQEAGVSSVLCKQANEPSREEVHDHGKGSPCGSLCMQEVPTLFTGIPNRGPYGS